MRPVLAFLLLQICMLTSVDSAVLFEKTEADLGFMYRDQPQRMVFPFENASDESLHITALAPSCDCTTAQVVPDIIGPRAKGEVILFIDPMGYETKGPSKEYVRLSTSDPESPEMLLYFSFEAGIGPEPEPRSLAFGKIGRGESDTLKLVIHPGRDQALNVLRAYSDTANVLVTQGGTDAHGDQEFTVVVKNLGPGGRLASFVTVATSDSLRHEIRVPVTASLLGKIVAEPDIVTFGAMLPGADVPQSVRVFSPEKSKFKISKITSTAEQLEVKANPLPDDAYDLRIKIREGSKPGKVTGEITVETDVAGAPALRITATGYVRATAK